MERSHLRSAFGLLPCCTRRQQGRHDGRARRTPTALAHAQGGVHAKLVEESTRVAFRLDLLSLEELSSILLRLHGNEALPVAVCCRGIGRLLADDSVIWTSFLRQEFHVVAVVQKGNIARYRTLFSRKRSRSIEWRHVPVLDGPENLSANPHMFCWHGHVFILGGWNWGGYAHDLLASKVAAPLAFRRIDVSGSPPPDSYHAAVAILRDETIEAEVADSSLASNALRVLLTGGYLFNGHHGESNRYGILEIQIDEGGGVQARWINSGEMPARANHSATFVPPSAAGGNFPKGYVLLLGGIQAHCTTESADILDLSTFEILRGTDLRHHGWSARNSHSATLIRQEDGTPAIEVLGGGTGDGRNGNSPRGGRDCDEVFLIRGLENAELQMLLAPGTGPSVGRGHIACRLPCTNTILAVGGGYPASVRAVAYIDGCPHLPDPVGDYGPAPRTGGCGCVLPDGTILVFGGHDHFERTRDASVWAARVDEGQSSFFDRLDVHSHQDMLRGQSDDSSGDSSLNRMQPDLAHLADSEGLEEVDPHIFAMPDFVGTSSEDSGDSD